MIQNSNPTPSTDLCLIVPILPGQAEAWRRFVQELQGPRQKAWQLWCRRIGTDTIQCRLQTTPQQAVVLLRITSRDGWSLPKLVENRPFDRWLRQQIRALHGIDIAHVAAVEQLELILDIAL